MAMTWRIRCWIPEKSFILAGGGVGGRGRKGREEDGEGKGVNVTYPVGEA